MSLVLLDRIPYAIGCEMSCLFQMKHLEFLKQ